VQGFPFQPQTYYHEVVRWTGRGFYRFMTCSRVPRPLDSLLSMMMREGETLKIYSNRYRETFNEIGGDFEDVAIKIFKVRLPTEHDLRKSLTMKLAKGMRQLMDCIDGHKQVEEESLLANHQELTHK